MLHSFSFHVQASFVTSMFFLAEKFKSCAYDFSENSLPILMLTAERFQVNVIFRSVIEICQHTTILDRMEEH
jgi:hypothetical protein